MRILAVLAGVGTLGAVALIYSGAYNIAADDPHWPITYQVLKIVRDRSVEVRSAALAPPDLSIETRIRSGAGNYDSMCVDCHLAPGMEESELSLGLYPKPPSWREIGLVNPHEAFWVIKHGIKMTGMPAWGKSMDDKNVWDIVAFMQKLPQLEADAYRELVASSSGHSHGRNETKPGDHTDMDMPDASGRGPDAN